LVKFNGNILQFGFGAVGKSFFEKASTEISYNEYKYYIIERYAEEFDAFIDLGGMAANFITCEITKENFGSVFERYLSSGDLLIDFADSACSNDLCDWCAERNIMYINTGNADWPDNWPNIFEQNKQLNETIEKHKNNILTNRHPIVLQHGNNPGLVSHFVKAGIEYIVDNQCTKRKHLKNLIKQNRYNEVAVILGLKMIHVNDIDLQQIDTAFDESVLYNTWCIDTFLFEMLTEGTFNTGTHENTGFIPECKHIDKKCGFLEFNKLSVEKKCRTFYPGGVFEGFLVTHEETASIAKNLEVIENGEIVYRPSVLFIYKPCDRAEKYLKEAKVNDYPVPDPDKPLDCDGCFPVIRGYKYPQKAEIAYGRMISSGTEYVGVLLMGDHFDPVWIGNRIELPFLYKDKKSSRWQTPTITPVAISALAAVRWMITNRDKGGIYFPDDITGYKDILKTAEKYISKTIFKTFSGNTVGKALGIDLKDIQAKDFFV